MPSDPIRLFALFQEIEDTPQDQLCEMERETLLGVQVSLRELKQRVDRTLLKLSFVNEQQLN